MIKIYSTPNCVYCVKAQKLLEKHNIEYQKIDVSTSSALFEEMFNKSGQMGVPVIDIDGDIMIGYNESKLKQKLGIIV